jgi:hypothetical protein
MSLEDVAEALRPHGLAVLGAFHPESGDGVPGGCGTLVMAGPDGPAFWDVFQDSAEFAGGAADPLNRWSERVLGGVAETLGAEALFPFGGPPWLPFIGWAKRTGRAWGSPVGLLVHEDAGLFVSYRGALALRERVALPEPGVAPCPACAKPCLSACPVGALTGEGYDVPACKAFIATKAGRGCLERGCAVRRACPVGAGLRPEAQSAFHMAAFRGTGE